MANSGTAVRARIHSGKRRALDREFQEWSENGDRISPQQSEAFRNRTCQLEKQLKTDFQFIWVPGPQVRLKQTTQVIQISQTGWINSLLNGRLTQPMQLSERTTKLLEVASSSLREKLGERSLEIEQQAWGDL